MTENRIEFQKASYDLCSYMLRALACPYRAPERKEYLEKIESHVFFDGNTCYMRSRYLQFGATEAIFTITSVFENNDFNPDSVIDYIIDLNPGRFPEIGIRTEFLRKLVDYLIFVAVEKTRVKLESEGVNRGSTDLFKQSMASNLEALLEMNLYRDVLL